MQATLPPNKIAMSKALGAAFLNHQVEQLEKSVNVGGHFRTRGGGPPPAKHTGSGPQRKKDRPEGNATNRKNHEETNAKAKVPKEKEADIIVADASVLVHGLDHLRRWCQRGREEMVIVPLEALNTLDLLKKSSKSAREASRILEKEVGTNPRIRVQSDDAFVLWDAISFTNVDNAASPEWVRRTICSARWELDHASSTLGSAVNASGNRKVVVAVSTPAPSTGPAERTNGSLVALWAKASGIEVLDLAPTPWNGGHGRKGSDEAGTTRNKRAEGCGNGGGGFGRTSPNRQREKQPLVERPLAPTKVIKVLARGEKLPDTP